MSTNHTARSRADQSAPSPSRAASAQTDSTPAGIDEVLMCRAHARVVRCEEQDHRSDVVRFDADLEALLLDRARFFLRRKPQLHLPRRTDRARYDAVDANAEGSQLARQSARQPFDARFRRLIDSEAR